MGDYAVLVLSIGYFVSRWTHKGRDAWLCAAGVAALILGELIFTESSTLGRTTDLIGVAVWVWIMRDSWRISGFPCRVYGHRWTTTAITPTGTFLLASKDLADMTILRLRLRGVDATYTYECAVCHQEPPMTRENHEQV